MKYVIIKIRLKSIFFALLAVLCIKTTCVYAGGSDDTIKETSATFLKTPITEIKASIPEVDVTEIENKNIYDLLSRILIDDLKDNNIERLLFLRNEQNKLELKKETKRIIENLERREISFFCTSLAESMHFDHDKIDIQSLKKALNIKLSIYLRYHKKLPVLDEIFEEYIKTCPTWGSDIPELKNDSCNGIKHPKEFKQSEYMISGSNCLCRMKITNKKIPPLQVVSTHALENLITCSNCEDSSTKSIVYNDFHITSLVADAENFPIYIHNELTHSVLYKKTTKVIEIIKIDRQIPIVSTEMLLHFYENTPTLKEKYFNLDLNKETVQLYLLHLVKKPCLYTYTTTETNVKDCNKGKRFIMKGLHLTEVKNLLDTTSTSYLSYLYYDANPRPAFSYAYENPNMKNEYKTDIALENARTWNYFRVWTDFNKKFLPQLSAALIR